MPIFDIFQHILVSAYSRLVQTRLTEEMFPQKCENGTTSPVVRKRSLKINVMKGAFDEHTSSHNGCFGGARSLVGSTGGNSNTRSKCKVSWLRRQLRPSVDFTRRGSCGGDGSRLFTNSCRSVPAGGEENICSNRSSVETNEVRLSTSQDSITPACKTPETEDVLVEDGKSGGHDSDIEVGANKSTDIGDADVVD